MTSPEDDAAWRAKVAEAARRAADNLAEEDAPQLRRLQADLEDLYERLSAKPDSGS